MEGVTAKSSMLMQECSRQNKVFLSWAEKDSFKQFHHSHYDWWAFPVDAPSSYGLVYQVGQQELTEMSESKEFIAALRSNAELVCRAWGYNLILGNIIQNPKEDQKWQDWPIRLYKMARSLQIFQQIDLHHQAVKYACHLIKRGCYFVYGKTDCKKYFLARKEAIGPQSPIHKPAKSKTLPKKLPETSQPQRTTAAKSRSFCLKVQQKAYKQAHEQVHEQIHEQAHEQKEKEASQIRREGDQMGI